MTAPVIELEDEIAHLRDLDLPGLRARWHSVFRRKAPDHLPRHLLYRMIAYRLQAERLGDLDRDTQRFLDRVAAGTRNGDELPAMPLNVLLSFAQFEREVTSERFRCASVTVGTSFMPSSFAASARP